MTKQIQIEAKMANNTIPKSITWIREGWNRLSVKCVIIVIFFVVLLITQTPEINIYQVELRIFEIVILIVFLKHCYDFLLYSFH